MLNACPLESPAFRAILAGAARRISCGEGPVVVQFGKEASQTRDYRVARHATLRAARPDPSLRKERLLKDDNQTAPLPTGHLAC